jgi:hypothetical protein
MYSIAAFTRVGIAGSRFLAGDVQKSSSFGGLTQLRLEPSVQKGFLMIPPSGPPPTQHKR